MKKRLLSLILIPMLLTSCSTQSEETETKDTNVKAVSESMLSDFEACKNKEYVNLDLSSCALHSQDFDSCSKLTIIHPDYSDYGFYDIEKSIETFEDYGRFLFGDEYDPECACFMAWDDEEVAENFEGTYPKISDYIERLKSGSIEEVSFFSYKDEHNMNYMWWHPSEDFPCWINKGETLSAFGVDSGVGSYIPSDIRDCTAAVYGNDGSNYDVSYQLLDGEVSVGEAIDYFENDYLDSLPCEFDENWSISVTNVEVYEINDDLYCYVFKFSTAWKGVSFAGIYGEYYSPQDTSSHYDVSCQAVMIKKTILTGI